MHRLMLVTITMSSGATSEDARLRVYSELVDDPSFCGEAGRFGSPLADSFVIGGRWERLFEIDRHQFQRGSTRCRPILRQRR